MTLKEGVTVNGVPHEIRVNGCKVLVLIPGRAPLCLRCRRKGHIRRDCRVPWCRECHQYGHEASDCVRTYASIAQQRKDEESTEFLMDEVEAEAATEGAGPPLSSANDSGSDASIGNQDNFGESSQPSQSEQAKQATGNKEQEVNLSPKPQHAGEEVGMNTLKDKDTLDSESEVAEPMSIDVSQTGTQQRDQTLHKASPNDTVGGEPPWQVQGLKKSRVQQQPRRRAASSSRGLRWFQLHVFRDREYRNLGERAERAGYRALVLTVGTPVCSQRATGTNPTFCVPDNIRRHSTTEHSTAADGSGSDGNYADAGDQPTVANMFAQALTDHQYSIMTSVDQALRECIRQVEELSSENERLRKDNDCLRKKNEALLKEVARLKNMYDEAEQVIDATVPPQVFTLTDVQQDSEKLAFYTGFESLKKLLAFVKFVRTGYDSYKQRQAPQGRPLNLSMEDQLLLVLSRLRVGLLEQDLAYRFGVHVSTVSRVWTFWVGFLADHLAQRRPPTAAKRCSKQEKARTVPGHLLRRKPVVTLSCVGPRMYNLQHPE
ncbi:hypothetical protein HPB47_005412 [Ixodes persulcatus]|uniref:Uncharacterized protein n=1 Tax=Ixodes persulcatus TaxID=34615 RepID=A0AC60PE98_IXOPE|nr:hypothetical protein HPB47_005412 [Ixodes persulcatus]